MYIVLDTNFLYGTFKDGVITLETTKLRLLMGLKEHLKFNISIPLPVLIELKRKAKERYNIYDDNNGLITSYVSTLDSFININSINILPFPSKMPGMENLFHTAVNKEFPFDRKGQSFRDAVIWYSVKEFADSNKKNKVLLISDDKHVSSITKSGNLETLRFDELKEKLEKLLPQKVKENRLRLREGIKDYLRENRIAEIKENLSLYHDFRLDLDAGETVINISDFIFSKAARVDLVEIKEKIHFTACINGELIYNVRVSLKNRKKAFRIGESIEDDTAQDITRENRIRGYVVFVDGVADCDESLGITSLEIHSVGKTELPKVVA